MTPFSNPAPRKQKKYSFHLGVLWDQTVTHRKESEGTQPAASTSASRLTSGTSGLCFFGLWLHCQLSDKNLIDISVNAWDMFISADCLHRFLPSAVWAALSCRCTCICFNTSLVSRKTHRHQASCHLLQDSFHWNSSFETARAWIRKSET